MPWRALELLPLGAVGQPLVSRRCRTTHRPIWKSKSWTAGPAVIAGGVTPDAELVVMIVSVHAE